jgi:hypothetical protein
VGIGDLCNGFDRQQLVNIEQVLGPTTQENERREVGL